jgi:hypothetical protein
MAPNGTGIITITIPKTNKGTKKGIEPVPIVSNNYMTSRNRRA